MRNLLVILSVYLIPAAIFFGTTIAVVRVAGRGLLLPIERGAWLLPGLVYTLLPIAIYKLEMTAPPKGMLNLVDPLIVALLCWLMFVGRIGFALRRPESNRTAAYATIALNMAIAAAVLFFLPPLPQ